MRLAGRLTELGVSARVGRLWDLGAEQRSRRTKLKTGTRRGDTPSQINKWCAELFWATCFAHVLKALF